jgi:hypothetical protein
MGSLASLGDILFKPIFLELVEWYQNYESILFKMWTQNTQKLVICVKSGLIFEILNFFSSKNTRNTRNASKYAFE